MDSLRGIAALAIAFRHAPFFWNAGRPENFFFDSYLAVDFFFVLSGFVLAHAYGVRVVSSWSLSHFMVRRVIRLYPLYFLALIIASVNFMSWAGPTNTMFLADAGAAIFFLPSPISPDVLFFMNSPSWSLFYELIANAFFGAAIRRPTLCAAIVLTSGAALVLALSEGWFGLGTLSGPLDAGATQKTAFAGLLRVGYSFFAGILIYRLWRRYPLRAGIPAWCLAGMLCAILMAFPPDPVRRVFDLVMVLAVFPAIVYFGAHSTPAKRFTPLFHWLGSVSYGVYVLQMPIFGTIYLLFIVKQIGGFMRYPVLSGVASMVAVVGVATLASRYFDTPLRRYIGGRLERRS